MMTNHIQLRDVVEADLPIFFEHQIDPEASRMASFPSRSREGFMSHWTKLLTDPSILMKTILFDGEIAGNIVCFEQLGEREVGYWIGRKYWGRGIATHALEDFLNQIETRPLYAHVAKNNIASRRVLEKCGFQVSGEDKFFSQILGDDIEEYILVLHDGSQPAKDK